MKGDVVQVILITGQELSIGATRRGRSVGVTYETKPRQGRWLVVGERAARSERAIGSSLEVRMEQVAAIRRLSVEP